MTPELIDTTPLCFTGGPANAGDYILSPFVYDGGRQVFVRAVPRLDDEPEQKISRVFYGRSADGINFELDPTPAIAPGPNVVDLGGVEDPTVVEENGTLYVFYSGWNSSAERSTLLRAAGPSHGALVKCGVVLPPSESPAKEATFVRSDAGWIMFYEVERGDASRNASATAPALNGVWTIGDDVLQPRGDCFDAWHLSPVAFVRAPDGARVLIYNGATRDGRWQIGWCELDETCSQVLGRPDQPLISASRNSPEQRELAFGASASTNGDELFIYYSIGDSDPACGRLRWRSEGSATKTRATTAP